MNCPNCNHEYCGVIRSRPEVGKRYRKCSNCGIKFATLEENGEEVFSHWLVKQSKGQQVNKVRALKTLSEWFEKNQIPNWESSIEKIRQHIGVYKQ